MVRFHAAALAVLALLAAGPATALVVDPDFGGSGEFYWDDGFGSSVFFGSRPPAGDETLEITMREAGTISLFAVADFARDPDGVGDTFVLVVDGVDTGWTETSGGIPGTSQPFQASVTDLFLTAGDHTIDLKVVSTAPGFSTGVGSWSMSAAVPEPSSALLACVGALVLRGSLRRRRPNP